MAIPTRTPSPVPPPLPVGSSTTVSIGSKTCGHQLMQEKLEIAKKCRAAMCKPSNTNQPSDDAITSAPTSTSTSTATSTSWH